MIHVTGKYEGINRTYALLIRKAFKYIYPVNPHRYFQVKGTLQKLFLNGALVANCEDFRGAFLWSDTKEGNAYWKTVSLMCKEGVETHDDDDGDNEVREII